MVTENKLLKIKTYPRKSRRRYKLSTSSKDTFLLNCHSSEREILNEEGWYLYGEFLTGFGIKTRALATRKHKITPAPLAFQMLGAHKQCYRPIRVWQKPCSRRMVAFRCIVHALRTWLCSLAPVSLIFHHFRFLSSSDLHRNLGTKFLLLLSLLRPPGSSFLVFPKSSQIFGCSWVVDLHDFFMNYFQNPLKLLCFRKTRITNSNIENITKVSNS